MSGEDESPRVRNETTDDGNDDGLPRPLRRGGGARRRVDNTVAEGVRHVHLGEEEVLGSTHCPGIRCHENNVAEEEEGVLHDDGMTRGGGESTEVEAKEEEPQHHGYDDNHDEGSSSDDGDDAAHRPHHVRQFGSRRHRPLLRP